MKNPEKFPWILTAGITFISTAFLSIGTLGYMAFGDNVAGSVSLNLPNTPYVSFFLILTYITYTQLKPTNLPAGAYILKRVRTHTHTHTHTH